jgi:hypothetical protein
MYHLNLDGVISRTKHLRRERHRYQVSRSVEEGAQSSVRLGFHEKTISKTLNMKQRPRNTSSALASNNERQMNWVPKEEREPGKQSQPHTIKIELQDRSESTCMSLASGLLYYVI